jgi:hypothetical protein
MPREAGFLPPPGVASARQEIDDPTNSEKLATNGIRDAGLATLP